MLGLSLHVSPRCCFPGGIPSFPPDPDPLLARHRFAPQASISSPQGPEGQGSLPPRWGLRAGAPGGSHGHSLGGISPNPPGQQGRCTAGGSLEASVSEQEKPEDAAESAFSSRRGKLRREEKGNWTPKTEKRRRNKGKRDRNLGKGSYWEGGPIGRSPAA